MAGEIDALAAIAPLKAKPDEARALIHACSKIAAADGDFDQTEHHALTRMRAQLGIDPG